MNDEANAAKEGVFEVVPRNDSAAFLMNVSLTVLPPK